MSDYQVKKEGKTNEIVSVFIIAASILLGFALWAPAHMTGVLGKTVKQVGHGLFGTLVVILPIFLLLIGLDRLFSKTKTVSRARKNCMILLFLSTIILISVIYLDLTKLYSATSLADKSSVFKAITVFWESGLDASLVSQSATWTGGLFGGLFGLSLQVLAGRTGAMVIVIAMILALIIVVFNVSYSQYLKKSASMIQETKNKLNEKRKLRAEQKEEELAKLKTKELNHFSEEELEGDPIINTEDSAFNYDLSKKNDDKDPHEVSSEWLKRELAKERNETYEEPLQVTYSMPSGSWAINKEDKELETAESYDYPIQNAGQAAEEVRDILDSSDFYRNSNLEEQKESVKQGQIRSDFENNSMNSKGASKKDFNNSKLNTRENMQVDGLTNKIQETSVEIIEDGGRGHWEDRSEFSPSLKDPSRKKPKRQIALTDKYIPPSYELLNDIPIVRHDAGKIKEIKELGLRLEQTLQDFGVDAEVINYTSGPTITRFELSPGPGVKVSRVTNLSDDIALALAAIGVRIEAPIPGKSAIGIEIPNKETQPVFLSSIIKSKAFRENDGALTAGIGCDIQGNEILCDLAKMPHLLIAGATGSGKSVCINSIIISLLYRSGPSDLRMIMIDPKVVELNIYNGIPHLLQPVVTDPKKAYGALDWAINEMEERYEKFADNSVRDFTAYNTLIKSGQLEAEKLPAIVIIIDELSDLMATTPTEVEDAIARLTAMARAAGIHLIIATQRPSVDVITGVIKANIPSRIAFTVASQVDSRTILDMGGAEKLLGKGDMLYYPQSASKPLRGQGSFVTDAEVEAVIRYLKDIYETDYDDEVAKAIESASGKDRSGTIGSVNDKADEEDELLEDALKLIIETEYASISLLQRRLSIGYPRAARIVDRLHDLGYIGPFAGSKPRKVLVTPEEYYESINESADEELE